MGSRSVASGFRVLGFGALGVSANPSRARNLNLKPGSPVPFPQESTRLLT